VRLVGVRCATPSLVKYFAKNAKLREDRGIVFEDIVFHIERGDLINILEHPTQSVTAANASSS
jgi:hypothetical protein